MKLLILCLLVAFVFVPAGCHKFAENRKKRVRS